MKAKPLATFAVLLPLLGSMPPRVATAEGPPRIKARAVAAIARFRAGRGHLRQVREVRKAVRANHPLLGGRRHIYGHQGYADTLGHQTAAGFDMTVRRKDVLDIDLQRTRPGLHPHPAKELALYHDPAIGPTRAVGPRYPLATTSMETLQRDVRIKVPKRPGAGLPPLSFANFLTRYPDQPVSIEVKTQAAAEALVRVVQHNPKLARRAEIFAFSDKTVRYLRRNLPPEAVVGAGRLQTAAFFLFSKTPLLRRLKFRTTSDVVALNYNLRQFTPVEQALSRLGRVGKAILDYPLINASTVKTAARSGLKLTAWSVNDVADAKRLLGLGVNAIYTDRLEVADGARANLPAAAR